MERLQPFKWRYYDLSLEVFNAVIVSEYTLGNQDRATIAIEEVLGHAKFLRDKVTAFLHRVKSLCETKDYAMAAHEGVRILNMFSYNIPLKPTKLDLVREKMKLRLAFKGRSYASLTNLPVVDDPLTELFSEVCRDCLFSGQPRLVVVIAWTAVRRAIEKGIGRCFPLCLLILGTLLGKKGEMSFSQQPETLLLRGSMLTAFCLFFYTCLCNLR